MVEKKGKWAAGKEVGKKAAQSVESGQKFSIKSILPKSAGKKSIVKSKESESIPFAQERISKIVALISELQSVEEEKNNNSEEIKALKQKFDKGNLPKFSYLQLVDKKKLKINELNQEKKELQEKLKLEMNELKQGLQELKDLLAFRVESEKIGTLQ